MDNMQAIIEECKTIKRDLGYTNQFIAEQTGVPEGTVSRVFGSRTYNFKYETIQPIIAFLVNERDDGPPPMPGCDIVGLYADIVSTKDIEIAAMKTEHREELGSLKEEHKENVQELKREYRGKIAKLERMNHIQRVLIIAMIAINLILTIIDFLFTSVGWWRSFPA